MRAVPGPLERARRRQGWILLAPCLAVTAAAGLWPLLATLGLAFTDATLGGGPARFVGLANFLDPATGLLADPDWWRALTNTLAFAAVSVTLETVLGVLVALLLWRDGRGSRILMAVVLIPWAMPTVVAAQLWRWMLNEQVGVVNRLLVDVGILDGPMAWTASPATAFWVVVAVDVWKTTPFVAALVLAALHGIPRGCLEAARLDGASERQVFLRVTLPLLRPALAVVVLFRTLDAVAAFEIFLVLTSGAREAMSMAVYVRHQMLESLELGYGAALATAMLLLTAGIALVLVSALPGRAAKGAR